MIPVTVTNMFCFAVGDVQLAKVFEFFIFQSNYSRKSGRILGKFLLQ